MAYTVNKGAEDQIIHAAVPSGDAVVEETIPNRVLVFFNIGVCILPVVFDDFRRFVLCGEIFWLKVHGMIQLHPDAVSTMNGVAAAVGAWERGVMGNRDGFTVGAFDYGCDDIPQCVMTPDGTVLAIGVGGSDIQTTAFRCGGCQRQEPVAAVDVQIFCDRTDFMCGVKTVSYTHLVLGGALPA